MTYNFQEGKEIARSMLEGYLQGKGINTSKAFCCLVPGHHDKHASMSMTKNKRQVHCFGACGQSYDIFDLVRFETGLEKYDLFKHVFEMFSIPVEEYTVHTKQNRQRNEDSEFWLTVKEASLIGIHLPSYQMIRRKKDVFGLVIDNGKQVYEAVGKKDLLEIPDSDTPVIGFPAAFVSSKQVADENGEIKTVACVSEDYSSEEVDLHMTPFTMTKVRKTEDGSCMIDRETGLPLIETVSWKDFFTETEFKEMVFEKLQNEIEALEAEVRTGRINYFRSEISRIQKEYIPGMDYSETYQKLWSEISSMKHNSDDRLKELHLLKRVLLKRQDQVNQAKRKKMA